MLEQGKPYMNEMEKLTASYRNRLLTILFIIQSNKDKRELHSNKDERELHYHLIKLFQLRDAILKVLTEKKSIPIQYIVAIQDTDDKLQENASVIEHRVGSKLLKQWRMLTPSSSASWWWNLDDFATKVKSYLFLRFVQGILFAIVLGLLTEIVRRFLSEGLESKSIIGTIGASIITFVAGSTFLDTGKTFIDTFIQAIWKRVRHQQIARMVVLIFLMVICLSFFVLSPTLATYFYTEPGKMFQQQGEIQTAIQSYRHALSLNSDDGIAQYQLAVAYEELVDYDKAVSEYQSIIHSDPTAYPAINNLARLYLLQEQKPEAALTLLNTVSPLTQDVALKTNTLTESMLIQYTLTKNRGWAYLDLGLSQMALSELQRSHSFRPNAPSAYCLDALALEKLGKKQAALFNWQACLDKAGDPNDVLEQSWIVTANERLEYWK